MTERDSPPALIFAPGSLAGAAPDLAIGFAAAFPDAAPPKFRFAMSGTLAAELLAGVMADVAIFADRGYAEAVRQAGMLHEPRALAGNRLCLLVRPERAEQIRTLADVAAPGVRVAVFPPDIDPCGAYTAALFEQEGLAEAMAAKAAANEVVVVGRFLPLQMLLASKTVDAAVVYATSAPGLADVATAAPLPAGADMRDAIVFTVGLVKREDRHPAAAMFVDWLLDDIGQTTLRRHGFLPPP